MTFKMLCPKCGSTSVSISRERNGFSPVGGTPILSCTCGTRLYGAPAIEAEYLRQKKVWKKPNSPLKPTSQVVGSSFLTSLLDLLQELDLNSRAVLLEMRPEVVKFRDLVRTFQFSRGEDPASMVLNRYDIEVATVERLYGEIAGEVEKGLRLTDAWKVQRLIQQVNKKSKDMVIIASKVPGLAGKCKTLLHQTLVVGGQDPCAWRECGNFALEGRKYCGDICRKHQARYNYKLRKAGTPPVAQPPTVQLPIAQPPTVKPPTVQLPVAKPPTVKPPTVQLPVAKPPTAQPPTAQPPTAQLPTAQLPTVYAALNREQLMEVNLQRLRKYARFGLDIIGASKIRGGKLALVSRILETRNGQ